VVSEAVVEEVVDRAGRARCGSFGRKALLVVFILMASAVASSAGRPSASMVLSGAGEGKILFALPSPNSGYLKINFLAAPGSRTDEAAGVRSLRQSVVAAVPGARELSTHSSLFKSTRNGYWWPSHEASWSYNPAGKPAALEGDAVAINAAAQTWNNASTNFHFESLGQGDGNTGACSTGGDGQNTVSWGPLEGTLLAVTCSLYRNDGGPLSTATEFDMKIDPDWAWTTGAQPSFDLQSVVTHEFGHALGLGHSADANSIMFADYPQGAIKRDLTGDDMDGLLGLYGQPAARPIDPGNRTLALSSGPNLITWPESDTDAASAFAGNPGTVRALYAFDPATGGWLHYFPGAPSYLNTLAQVREGSAYWLLSNGSASLAFPDRPNRSFDSSVTFPGSMLVQPIWLPRYAGFASKR
jgi:hypothetical protein